MAESQGFLERHHFLLRRLHSLTGIVPIGVFVLFHLTTNASIVWGRITGHAGHEGAASGVSTFQHEVNFIHSLPALFLIEVFGLWLPLAFHSLLGIAYAIGGRPNLDHYKYQSNARYVLQRLSGYIGFVFIFYHVATLRWGWSFLIPGGTEWSGEYAASTMAAALQGGDSLNILGIVVSIFYMLGVSLLVFHLANGLWTAAITWGLTVTEGAQKRWGQICAALGVLLMAAAWSAVLGFVTLDQDTARQVEAGMLGPHFDETVEGPEVVASETDEALLHDRPNNHQE